jgi:hypothetical protein
MFTDKPTTMRRAKKVFNHFALDGVLDDDVFMPHNLPSNSLESRVLRQEKLDEIQDVIKEDLQHEASRSTASDGETNSGSLVLRRPSDLEPYDARYKKQGLTRSDRDVAARRDRLSQNRERDRDQALSMDGSPTAGTFPADDGLELICYCREPAGDEYTVQCCYELCLVGRFHIKCCNEEDFDIYTGDFYCEFCANLANSDPEAEGTGGLPNVATSGALPVEAVGTPPIDEGYIVEGTVVASEELGETHSDESPRTPSTPRTPMQQLKADLSYLSSPYSGTPTEFVTINPRPVQQDSSPSRAGLDGALDYKSETISAFESIAGDHGSPQVTFTDFAPFITYESWPSTTGLNENEIMRVEGWRYCMPRSKLLSRMSNDDMFIDVGGVFHGPRLDIKIAAEQWINTMVHFSGRKRVVFEKLSKWLKY